MNSLNPQTAADYGTLLGGIAAGVTAVWGGIKWVFSMVVTKSQLLEHEKRDGETFVKKVEADGTRAYVHPSEWEEMKKRMDASIAQGDKWQAIAKDWMNHP